MYKVIIEIHEEGDLSGKIFNVEGWALLNKLTQHNILQFLENRRNE